MTLSACMIVKNEEDCLARALDSVKNIADEIVIADTGSTDKTKDIARRYTRKIFDFEWCDDFSKARNFSLSKATKDWIFVLDADEVIAFEDHDAIRALMSNQHAVGYAFLQASYTNDTAQYNYTPRSSNHSHEKYSSYTKHFSGYISCNIIRLFRNHRDIFFSGAVHESVDASCKEKGKVEKSDVWIHHYQFEKGSETLKRKQLQYLNIYERHLADYPDQARAHRDIGSIYYTYAHDYAKAAASFERSLGLNNKNKKTYVGLGLCYLQLRRFSDARRIFEEALFLFPQDSQLLRLAQHARQS